MWYVVVKSDFKAICGVLCSVWVNELFWGEIVVCGCSGAMGRVFFINFEGGCVFFLKCYLGVLGV